MFYRVLGCHLLEYRVCCHQSGYRVFIHQNIGLVVVYLCIELCIKSQRKGLSFMKGIGFSFSGYRVVISQGIGFLSVRVYGCHMPE